MGKHARLIKNNLTPEREILFEHKRLTAPSTVHWHDFYELDIILAGEGRTFINGKEYACRAGSIVFMTPSDFHDYSCRELEIFNIQFTQDSVDRELLRGLVRMSGRIGTLKEAGRESMGQLLELFEKADMAPDCRKLYYRRLLEGALIWYMQSLSGGERAMQKSEPDIIQEIILYVNAHFAESPMLKEIAADFHMNENYLCSLFKAHMEESYKSYVRKLKLGQAQKLIAHTGLPITEIAQSCGYRTQSHFNREFQKMFCMTPLEMRKKSRDESREKECKGSHAEEDESGIEG